MGTANVHGGRLQARRPLRGLALAALALAALTTAQPLVAQTPHLGGFLSLDRRFEIGDDSVLVADFYNRLRAELSVSPSGGVDLFASLDVRAWDFPRARSGADLEGVDRHFPTEISLWEGYVQLWDFLVPGLDLRVGRQRIQWGTADKLNPTDLLNAYDFSDLVNFTDKVPTWAARAEYYLGGLTLTGVWSPTAHAPLLPRGGAALFFGGVAGAGDPPITSMDVHIEEPSQRLGESLGAFKVAGNAWGTDWSLSYVSGYDGVPFAKRLDLRPAGDGTGADGYQGVMTLGFTRTHTLGADFATEVAGMGLWGEAALVFPRAEERIVATTVGSTTVEERQAALDNRAYVRSTVGLDYTFSGGWYANAQWAHGLFFERGTDALHDYFVGRVERSFHQDEIKTALGGAGEVATWSGARDNLGYGFFPELTYTPADNVEVVVGAFVVGGRGASLFGTWDDTDQIYTRFKVSF